MGRTQQKKDGKIMPGLIDQAIEAGIESPNLLKQYRPMVSMLKQQGRLGNANIQYHPKDIASVCTLIKQCSVQSYLALDSSKTGGHKFIADKCNIQIMDHMDVQNDLTKEKAFLKQVSRHYDLISIDTREYKLSPSKIWEYIEGGLEEKEGFGKGAPTNFGIKKIAPKGLVLINFTKEEDKKLFFFLRKRYNKAYQSQFCGLVKL